MTTATKVFLSVGRTSNEKQESFVKMVEKYLEDNDLTPQTVGRTYFSSKQPLVAVAELMHECAGTIVLAFERVHLVEAIEKRGNPKEAHLQNINLPTVWNQIEASMAYMVNHPLLVIVEAGMKDEGLLEMGYDWYVKKVTLEDDLLTDPEFVGIISDWKRRVQAFQQNKDVETTRLATPSGQVPHNILVKLRQILEDRFSPAGLQTLCFDLGIDYENIPGDEHQLKTLHLIQELERKNRIDDLIKWGEGNRKDIDW